MISLRLSAEMPCLDSPRRPPDFRNTGNKKPGQGDVHDSRGKAAPDADRIGGRRRHAGGRRPGCCEGGKYKESPLLAEQVKAGKLPAVDQRLPQNPLVVPVVDKVGEYGGTWRRAFLGPADFNNYVRVVYDALFRFSPD